MLKPLLINYLHLSTYVGEKGAVTNMILTIGMNDISENTKSYQSGILTAHFIKLNWIINIFSFMPLRKYSRSSIFKIMGLIIRINYLEIEIE